jgi:hypothetical protein
LQSADSDFRKASVVARRDEPLSALIDYGIRDRSLFRGSQFTAAHSAAR